MRTHDQQAISSSSKKPRPPRTRASCARAGAPAQACGSACAVCQRPRTGHCCFFRAESACAGDEGFIKDLTRRSAPRPCCRHASPCPSTPAARPPPPPAPHRQRLTSALLRRRSRWAGRGLRRAGRSPACKQQTPHVSAEAHGKRGCKRRAHRSCSAASRAASLPCPSIWRITSCNRSSRSSARAFSEFSTAAKCASFSLESKQPTTSGPLRCGKQWV